MTLSARLAAGPSRRIALWSALMPAGGVAATASVVAARWPAWLPVLVPVAVAVALGLAAVGLARQRRTGVLTLTVGARPEIDVFPDPASPPGSWRLAESTVAWSGFAMLALRKSDPSVDCPVLRLAILETEVAPADRRALARFLSWSLRGGARSGDPSRGADRS